MRAWKSRERKLAGVTVAMALSAVAVDAVFVPQWKRYTQLRDGVTRLELGLIHMQANMRSREQIERRYEQLKGLIRESGSPSQELSRFARLLSELYQPLKLQTRSVRPLPDEDEDFYRKFTFSLEMEGPVGELAKFLAATARVVDPIRIERVQLNCRERAEHVSAQVIVTKVATTSRPAGVGERPVAGRKGLTHVRPTGGADG